MTSEVDNGPVAILVVEDDVLVRITAGDILTDAGFLIYEAHDAQEAMTLLEARADVRVVFSDWNMPGEVDGLGLARLVIARWPEVGVIVTSGKMCPYRGGLPEGARFISKPYRPSALIEEINAMVPGGGEVAQGGAVLPAGVAMQSPVTAGIGGMGIAAAPPEADKT